MLNRYNKSLTKPYVPISGNRYTVLIDGTILDNYLGTSVVQRRDSNGEKIVTLDWIDGVRDWKVSVVVAITYKNIQLTYRYWDSLSVLYHDGNYDNVHPANLVWKFPSQGLRLIGRPEFRIIPGLSSYAIDENDNIVNWKQWKLMESYRDTLGYVMFGVTPDIGPRTILGLHRLKCLAFLDYPSNVDDLDVNHLDGVKWNNELPNLEWASRKRNVTHAYEMGLRADNVPVSVYRILEDKVSDFVSMQQAAASLGVTQTTVANKLMSCGQVIFKPGYLIKRTSDPTPWLDRDFCLAAIEEKRKKLLVHAQSGNDEIVFESVRKAAIHFGKSPAYLHRVLTAKKSFSADGYVLRLKST